MNKKIIAFLCILCAYSTTYTNPQLQKLIQYGQMGLLTFGTYQRLKLAYATIQRARELSTCEATTQSKNEHEIMVKATAAHLTNVAFIPLISLGMHMATQEIIKMNTNATRSRHQFN